jgi:hypothetical protein
VFRRLGERFEVVNGMRERGEDGGEEKGDIGRERRFERWEERMKEGDGN